jgi:hypothetical protein
LSRRSSNWNRTRSSSTSCPAPMMPFKL